MKKRLLALLVSLGMSVGISGFMTGSVYAGPGYELTWRNDLPAQDSYFSDILDGSEIHLLQSVDGGQILSSIIKTSDGHAIIVDGGRRQDAAHLIDVLNQMGIGAVDAWLITHPHNDHLGALTQILEDKYIKGLPAGPEIQGIYYSFLDSSYYQLHDSGSRYNDLIEFYNAVMHTPSDKIHYTIKKDDIIPVGLSEVRVMNDPLATDYQTYNNSSVAFRITLPNGKRALYLGDMGSAAGEKLLTVNKKEDLKADIVQMSHHGQQGVDFILYDIIHPTIAMWPTPEWLWDNEKNGIKGEGEYLTLSVRSWMKKIGVARNLVCGFGDQILR